MDNEKHRFSVLWAGVSLVTTLILFLLAQILGLPSESKYIVAATGIATTVAVTGLQLNLDRKAELIEKNIKTDVIDQLKVYRTIVNLNDAHLQGEILSLLEKLEKGEVPAYMAATRTRSLVRDAKISCHSIYPIKDLQDLYNWLEYPRHKTWLDDNKAAAQRGVRFERTFIVSKSNAVDASGRLHPKVAGVFKDQLEHLVEVSVIWAEELEKAPVHSNLEQTFTIFDDKEVIVYEGKGNNRIYREPSVKVKEYVDIFSEQRKYSRLVRPLLDEQDSKKE